MIEVIKEAITENIGTLKPATKNWSKRCCMLCHTQGHGADTRNRFGIQFNVDSIIVNCFNCGFSAAYTEGKSLSKAFKFFLKQIHISEKLIQKIEFDIYKNSNGITTTRDGETIGIDPLIKYQALLNQWTPTELPEGSLEIKTWLKCGVEDENFENVLKYLESRRLYDYSKFFWCPDEAHNFNKRFIIPYYYKNKLVGYTARLCNNSTDKSIPKYFQKTPSNFVYNLDNQRGWERKYVILTEGVLDAFVVDGISTLGQISDAKIDIINRLQKQIIVSPDRDKAGEGLVKAAINNGWAVSFPKWEHGIKDAADAANKYGRLLTTHSIISSAEYNKDKIKIQWDIESLERNRINK